MNKQFAKIELPILSNSHLFSQPNNKKNYVCMRKNNKMYILFVLNR